MKRSISLAVFVAVLVVLALWLSLRGRTGEAGAGTLASLDARAGKPTVLEDALDAAATAEQERAALQPEVAHAIEAPKEARDENSISLIVRDRSTGEPVAQAEVFALALPRTDAVAWPKAYYQELGATIDRAVELGARSSSDEHGRVAVPFVDANTCVFVRKGRLAGTALLEVDRSPPSELWLDEDWTLVVQVVDESGAPRADVPVALNVQGQSAFRDDVLKATTRGAQGEAELAHAGLVFAQTTGSAHAAQIAWPLDPPSEVDLDADTQPIRRATLVLPPTGEVEVTIQHGDGTPWLDALPVSLEVSRLRTAATILGARRTRLESRDGRVLFRNVCLSSWVTARASIPPLSLVSVDGAGPTVAGQRVALLLREDPRKDRPWLHGRLLDESGRPLGERTLQLMLAWGEPRSMKYSSDARSASNGEFRTWLYRDPDGAAQLDLGVLDANGLLTEAVSAELNGPLGTSVTELGDLVMRRLPVLYAGRVERADGTPVARATITLSTTKPVWSGFPPQMLRSVTDASGRFEMRGLVHCESMVVVARHPGFADAFVEAPPGATNLALVLERDASIEGSVQPSALSFGRGLYVCDRQSESIPGRYARSTADPDPHTGSFAFQGLSTGKHDISLWATNWIGDAVTLAEIVLGAGEVNRDPRLQQIDAASLVHEFDLDVRASDGSPVRFLTLRACAADTNGSRHHVDSYAHRVVLHSASDELEVEVRAPDMRSVTLRCREGKTSCVLTAGFEVRLQLGGPLQLDAPFGVLPILVNHQNNDNELNWHGVPFDERGVCTVRVPDAGEYALDFYLTRGEQPCSSTIPLDEPPTITVKNVEGVQTFDVALPHEALEQALQSLRK